jgi:hypothetical protein
MKVALPHHFHATPASYPYSKNHEFRAYSSFYSVLVHLVLTKNALNQRFPDSMKLLPFFTKFHQLRVKNQEVFLKAGKLLLTMWVGIDQGICVF